MPTPAMYLLIGSASFAVAALTLLAGFGLGTLLLPAFAIFFPAEIAVAMVAVVHALNNLFKLALLGRRADLRILVAFGVPAVAASAVGAWTLSRLAEGAPLATWELAGHVARVTPLKLAMGGLILLFALADVVPALRRLQAPRRWLPLGGLLSGYFGGLSGHQGALRAAFIAPLGLVPAVYVGTQAALAIMVDITRLLVYGNSFLSRNTAGLDMASYGGLLAVATGCAFAGSLLGRRLLPKVTVSGVRVLAGILLVVVGLGLVAGVI